MADLRGVSPFPKVCTRCWGTTGPAWLPGDNNMELLSPLAQSGERREREVQQGLWGMGAGAEHTASLTGPSTLSFFWVRLLATPSRKNMGAHGMSIRSASRVEGRVDKQKTLHTARICSLRSSYDLSCLVNPRM